MVLLCTYFWKLNSVETESSVETQSSVETEICMWAKSLFQRSSLSGTETVQNSEKMYCSADNTNPYFKLQMNSPSGEINNVDSTSVIESLQFLWFCFLSWLCVHPLCKLHFLDQVSPLKRSSSSALILSLSSKTYSHLNISHPDQHRKATEDGGGVNCGRSSAPSAIYVLHCNRLVSIPFHSPPTLSFTSLQEVIK